MEPATASDIVTRYFALRPDLKERTKEAVYPLIIHSTGIEWFNLGEDAKMQGKLVHKLRVDLGFATALARLKYWMAPEELPDHRDIAELANYWKTIYNTSLGSGDPQQFFDLYNDLCVG